ncbi:vertnin [Elysia marginata]|uniref:Vertnin n=1 Tax=Elysia marginata TaxID=1093978 RepID=A0AAV4HYU7_9GAST|nr:vertnin [Elysia marginata]
MQDNVVTLSGLRPKAPKPPPTPRKTNAEKCREYRERLKKEDPEKDQLRRQKNHANAKKWRDNLEPEEKQRQRELGRLRQQQRRQKLKEKENVCSPAPKTGKKGQPTPTRASAKLHEQKEAHKRELAKVRQARRREKIKSNPQKLRREREKRRRRYQEKKAKTNVNACDTPERKGSRTPWRVIFQDAKKKLNKCRNKLALIKLDFLKRIQSRGDVNKTKSYYIRKKQQTCGHLVGKFLNEVAVDIPFQKSGAKPKKVLTKTMNDLYIEFKQKYPDIKISPTTFKRLRPDNILLVNSTNDGCSSQYKSRLPFLHLSQLQAMHRNLKLRRHYFGAGHGKSLCDSAGGTVKNCATRAVAAGKTRIQSAQDLLEFCNRELLIPPSQLCSDHVVRSFELITSEEVVRDMSVDDVKAVKGTQSIHSVIPSEEEGNIRVRLLSCFCPVCLVGERGVCENQEFTLDWKSASVLKKASAQKDQLSTARTTRPLTKVPRKCQIKTKGKSKGRPVLEALQLNSVFTPPAIETAYESHQLNGTLSDESDNIPMDRDNFFSHVYSELSVCNSVEAVQKVVNKLYPLFKNFQLPSVTPKSLLGVNGCIDRVAKELIPEGVGCGLLYPVLVQSDGNCVPRTLSLAVFGTEDMHLEVRCRIVFELASNINYYVNSLDDSMSRVLCETSNQMCDTVRETFLQELLEIKSLGTFMGLWQLMAASNIFCSKIVSVYPSKGIACHRKLFNRVLVPRNGMSSSPITILWSSTRDLPEAYWTANHVVLLVPISDEIIVEVE